MFCSTSVTAAASLLIAAPLLTSALVARDATPNVTFVMDNSTYGGDNETGYYLDDSYYDDSAWTNATLTNGTYYAQNGTVLGYDNSTWGPDVEDDYYDDPSLVFPVTDELETVIDKAFNESLKSVSNNTATKVNLAVNGGNASDYAPLASDEAAQKEFADAFSSTAAKLVQANQNLTKNPNVTADGICGGGDDTHPTYCTGIVDGCSYKKTQGNITFDYTNGTYSPGNVAGSSCACVAMSDILPMLGNYSSPFYVGTCVDLSVVLNPKCPCNVTYVSEACCNSTDGIVHEDASKKLGELDPSVYNETSAGNSSVPASSAVVATSTTSGLQLIGTGSVATS
ncbi:MAG: hypothetical protein M1814_006877 [Vezdaea aestivalis]|nr:MAG: hypothetical protein M1814_006877 [Vezdaea aestivalis]